MNMAEQFIKDVYNNIELACKSEKTKSTFWEIVKINDIDFCFIKSDSSAGNIKSNMFKCFFSINGEKAHLSLSEIYFQTEDGFELCFNNKTGLIINKNYPEELQNNVFDWTEEDFFYFKLKYGE